MEPVEIGGNGHKRKTVEELALEGAFKGVKVRLGELVRQDGIMAEAMDKAIDKGRGVIETLITADGDKDYRQILKRGRWKSQEQRDKYVKALAVCRLTGAVQAAQTLLDMITADTAGDNGALIHEAFEGITHTTFTSRSEMDKKGKNDNRHNNSASPIA